MGQLPKINTIEDLSVAILVHQKMSRKQYHVAFWIWDPKSYQSPKHSIGDFEGFTQNSCCGICHCVWVVALSRLPKIHFSWILLFNQNQRICYVSYLAKNKHTGGFHLHLLVYPFIYQFNSTIGVLVHSSFAND